MIIPSKFENLNKNILVIGAHVIRELKKAPVNVEDLFGKLKQKEYVANLDQYFDTLTFLWTSNIIDLKKYQVCIKK